MSTPHAATDHTRCTSPHPLGGTVALCLLMAPVMVAGWILSFAPFDDCINRDGKPFLADFICFYIAGECVADGQLSRLYDDDWAHNRSLEILPQLDGGMNLPYRYPPLFAALAAPLSWASFPLACVLFLSLQVLSLIWLFRRWRNDSPALQALDERTFLIACLGFPLTMECLMGGQLTTFTLLIIGSSILLGRRGELASAGAVLGLAMFKPNVALLFTLGCLVRFPRMLIGIVLTGVGMLTFTLCTTGLQSLREYVQLGQRLATQTWQTAAPTWKIHGLEPLFAQIVPDHSKLVTLLLGAGLVITVALLWRYQRMSDADGYSWLLIINALFGMYVPIYDLLLLLPVLWLQAEQVATPPGLRTTTTWRLASPGTLPALGLLIAVGPHLSQALVMQSGWQPFSLVMLIAPIWSMFIAGRPEATDPARTPELSTPAG